MINCKINSFEILVPLAVVIPRKDGHHAFLPSLLHASPLSRVLSTLVLLVNFDLPRSVGHAVNFVRPLGLQVPWWR
jgi:hypothetical protein